LLLFSKTVTPFQQVWDRVLTTIQYVWDETLETTTTFLIFMIDAKYIEYDTTTDFVDPCRLSKYDLGFPNGFFAERFFQSRHAPVCRRENDKTTTKSSMRGQTEPRKRGTVDDKTTTTMTKSSKRGAKVLRNTSGTVDTGSNSSNGKKNMDKDNGKRKQDTNNDGFLMTRQDFDRAVQNWRDDEWDAFAKKLKEILAVEWYSYWWRYNNRFSTGVNSKTKSLLQGHPFTFYAKIVKSVQTESAPKKTSSTGSRSKAKPAPKKTASSTGSHSKAKPAPKKTASSTGSHSKAKPAAKKTASSTGSHSKAKPAPKSTASSTGSKNSKAKKSSGPSSAPKKASTTGSHKSKAKKPAASGSFSSFFSFKFFTTSAQNIKTESAQKIRGWVLSLLKQYSSLPPYIWYLLDAAEMLWTWRGVLQALYLCYQVFFMTTSAPLTLCGKAIWTMGRAYHVPTKLFAATCPMLHFGCTAAGIVWDCYQFWPYVKAFWTLLHDLRAISTLTGFFWAIIRWMWKSFTAMLWKMIRDFLLLVMSLVLLPILISIMWRIGMGDMLLSAVGVLLAPMVLRIMCRILIGW
jgi:hypothetical protein